MYNKKIIDHGIIQVDPLPSEEDLKNFYAKEYYQTSDGHKNPYNIDYSEVELNHKKLEARLSIHALTPSLSRNPNHNKVRLIDFGCGEGFFLQEAFHAGWDIYGVDFSEFAIKKWHPQFLNKIHIGDFYDYLQILIQNNQQFDICVLKNVLEHVRNPQQLIIDLQKILTPNGQILITIPNDYSAIQQLAMNLGHIDREFWFAPPDHLFYFNTKNIYPFMENLGMHITDLYGSFPIDFYLFHPGSNYIKDKTKGKAAHIARMQIDLLLGSENEADLLNLYRALAKCGIGRGFTIIARKLL